MWTGLTKPFFTPTPDTLKPLMWIDGDEFDNTTAWFDLDIVLDDHHFCMSMNQSGVYDEDCSLERRFTCEFSCSDGEDRQDR